MKKTICPYFKKKIGCELVMHKQATFGCGKGDSETAQYYYKECGWYKRYHPNGEVFKGGIHERRMD